MPSPALGGARDTAIHPGSHPLVPGLLNVAASRLGKGQLQQLSFVVRQEGVKPTFTSQTRDSTTTLTLSTR